MSRMRVRPGQENTSLSLFHTSFHLVVHRFEKGVPVSESSVLAPVEVYRSVRREPRCPPSDIQFGRIVGYAERDSKARGGRKITSVGAGPKA